MELKTILQTLCEASGVNGEDGAAALAARYLSEFTEDIHIDPLGNVIGRIAADTPDAPLLLLEAHIDEIGFVVTGIDDQGFVHVTNCGGIDTRVLSASEVLVLADTPLNGVFCSTPPHLAKPDAALPEISAMGIDVGLSKEEATAQIPLGTRVVFRPHFDTLLNDRVCSKAIDNRAGVAAVLGALKLVKGKALPFNLAISFSAQEELGLNGAKTAAFSIMPDAAIVVDVSFAHTHDVKREHYATLGKGAMIGQAPVLDKYLTKQLFALAQKENIAVQHEVMGEKTGTDADMIGTVGSGVSCALLSVPLKYMHTPIETVSLRDIESVSRLIAAFILNGEVSDRA